MRARSILLFAIAAAAAVTGCGGGGQSTSTTVTASSLTKAAFLKRATTICRNGRDRLAAGNLAYVKQHPSQSQQETFVTVVKTVEAPVVRSVVDELRALGAPAAEVDEVEAITNGLQKAADELEAKNSFDTAEAQQLLRLGGDKALRYGADECAFGY